VYAAGLRSVHPPRTGASSEFAPWIDQRWHRQTRAEGCDKNQPQEGSFLMSNRITRAALCAAFICAALGGAAPACAALGGSPTPPPAGAVSTSIAPIVHAASGAASAATAASYTVTQTTFGSGTVVREYVSTAGTVFGIAWAGPVMPNLSALLGTYFPQFDSARNALRTARPGRGPLVIELPGLVVRSGGHMGAFGGQAYLPSALPAGVSASDIQ
jgi:hypothetical protein